MLLLRHCLCSAADAFQAKPLQQNSLTATNSFLAASSRADHLPTPAQSPWLPPQSASARQRPDGRGCFHKPACPSGLILKSRLYTTLLVVSITRLGMRAVVSSKSNTTLVRREKGTGRGSGDAFLDSSSGWLTQVARFLSVRHTLITGLTVAQSTFWQRQSFLGRLHVLPDGNNQRNIHDNRSSCLTRGALLATFD